MEFLQLFTRRFCRAQDGGVAHYVALVTRIKSFVSSDKGVTAIEYALIAALIAVVIIGAVTLLGNEVEIIYNAISTAVQNANS